jgi:hypothetical protein
MELHEIEAKSREIESRIDALRRTSETNVENFFRAHLEFVGTTEEIFSEIINATTNETVLNILIGTPFGIAITAHLTPEQKQEKNVKGRLLEGLQSSVRNIAAELKTEPRGRQAVGTLVLLLHAALLALSDQQLPTDQRVALVRRWLAHLDETSKMLTRYESEMASE